ncbi:MAG TPA: CpsD/CapB family tyrosine-protein kinase [Tepidisphaeraceae bacterium]|nr:CpsD/CapB family tyrosine-protein kinase [Tepidisphaeraceae bacterium]
MTTLADMSRSLSAPSIGAFPPAPRPAAPIEAGQLRVEEQFNAGFINLLGTLPYQPDDFDVDRRRLARVVFEVPYCRIAEKLRKLRTRLKYGTGLDANRTIVVTSAAIAEGKSVVAGNLAAALALDGRRTLLVDANFARPSLHRTFGVDFSPGFTDLLKNPDYCTSLATETDLLGLSLLTCGQTIGFSMEWLLPEMVLPLMARALQSFDHVIFDAGTLTSAPAVALGRLVNGVITVVKAHTGDVEVMKRLAVAMRRYHINHLGSVLNGVRPISGGRERPSAGTARDGQAA